MTEAPPPRPPAAESSRSPARRLCARVRLAGGVLALLHGAWALLSWAMVARVPFGREAAPEGAMLRRAAEALPGLPPAARAALGDALARAGPFADEGLRLAVAGALLGAMALVAAWLVGRVARAPGAEDPRVARTLFRGALALGAVSLLAIPACTLDVWLNIGWGRMVAAGLNPYYAPLAGPVTEGLPVVPGPLRFTYGPLWACLLGGLAWLAGGRLWLEVVLLKALLAAAWVACLALARRIAAPRGGRAEAMALALLGWLPLSAHYSLAEMHNDVAMVAPLLLALALARSGAARAPLALAASALVKYVTAPLLLLDAWRALRAPGTTRAARRAWAAGMAAALVLAVALFVPFARDLHFFASTRRMTFGILSPGKALRLLVGPLPGPGLSRTAADLLVLGALAALFAAPALRFLRRPTAEGQILLSFGALSAVALAGVGHTWPWFLLWPLATGALVWPAWPLRLLVGLLVVAPLFDLFWLQEAGWSAGDRWTLGLFALAAAATPVAAWWMAPRRPPAPC